MVIINTIWMYFYRLICTDLRLHDDSNKQSSSFHLFPSVSINFRKSLSALLSVLIRESGCKRCSSINIGVTNGKLSFKAQLML